MPVAKEPPPVPERSDREEPNKKQENKDPAPAEAESKANDDTETPKASWIMPVELDASSVLSSLTSTIKSYTGLGGDLADRDAGIAVAANAAQRGLAQLTSAILGRFAMESRPGLQFLLL